MLESSRGPENSGKNSSSIRYKIEKKKIMKKTGDEEIDIVLKNVAPVARDLFAIAARLGRLRLSSAND